ncbi:acyloxyacyl hydrolase [Rhizobium paknamense]|uniref:Acyloxyacyl hydrolase n=1 Tax=Rhizobium paknamense TaxID=1206817 RepID=A0ABU0I9C0_9HYPH|nr:acyloxyacyl hydrolase [Rhizobium paknamense]MDQ0453819.1 hypothetical protein [Rhizobium paknamense]
MMILAASTLFAFPSFAGSDHILDEVRLGAVGSLQDHETGVAFEGTAFFDPFDRGDAPSLMDSLKHPRPFLGGEVGTSSMNNQLYGGLAWTFDISDRIFTEIGLGGVVHDGAIDDQHKNGPDLGCRVLFREHAAVGYRLDKNWSLVGQIEHTSNANLCDPNDGMTRAGLLVGYKF